MKATTIKLESPLLEKIEAAKPKDQSLTSYVRAVLESELRRQKVAEAAAAYTVFLKEHPEEAAALEAWDRADLAKPPRRRGRKS
jgi:hypothetical protein